jgi:hypothetical protein
VGLEGRQKLDWPSSATEPRSWAFVRLPIPASAWARALHPAKGADLLLRPARTARQNPDGRAALPTPNRSVAHRPSCRSVPALLGRHPTSYSHSRTMASGDRSVTSDLPPDGEPGGAQRRLSEAPRRLEGNHRGVGAVEKWPAKGPRRVGGCRCGLYPAAREAAPMHAGVPWGAARSVADAGACRDAAKFAGFRVDPVTSGRATSKLRGAGTSSLGKPTPRHRDKRKPGEMVPRPTPPRRGTVTRAVSRA